MITLYSHPQSRGIRVQKLLEVFEIPHNLEVIDFHKGEHRKPDYLKIHPYGRVPALRDGDVTLVESGAITLYLADKFAELMNTPAPGSLERALLHEWLFFFQATLEGVVTEYYRTEDREVATKKIEELLKAMASRFRGPYALGESFSVLDVVLNVELTWYKIVGLYPDRLEPYDSFLELSSKKVKWEVPTGN